MSAKSIVKGLSVAIIGVTTLTHCSGSVGTSPETTAKLAPESQSNSKQEENERGLRAAMGAASILGAARNPDSVHFTSVLIMKDGTVCYAYRAQNGFGGFTREVAILPSNPKTKSLSRSSAFWNAHCANKEGDDYTALINSRAALLSRLAGNN